jgi:holdfast attachment protein HfaA
MTSSAARAPRLAYRLAYTGALILLIAAQGAAAQTMTANSAAFNAGFGRTAGEENRGVNVSLTDANGNTTLANGLIQPVAGSIFGEVSGAVGGGASAGGSSSSAGGAGDSFTGAGSGSSATAIGNSLNVIVQGDNNTVIVNATQTNNGAVTATTSSSGK